MHIPTFGFTDSEVDTSLTILTYMHTCMHIYRFLRSWVYKLTSRRGFEVFAEEFVRGEYNKTPIL
jgi:hypothetical protein